MKNPWMKMEQFACPEERDRLDALIQGKQQIWFVTMTVAPLLILDDAITRDDDVERVALISSR